jgi:hypothetical protein
MTFGHACQLLQREALPPAIPWRGEVLGNSVELPPEWLVSAAIDCLDCSMDSPATDCRIDRLCVERARFEAWLNDRISTKRDAQLSSQELKEAANRRDFDELSWPTNRLVAWIAFRDPKHLGKSWRAAAQYDHSTSARQPPLMDTQPLDTLLRALREDQIRAIDQNGAEMEPDAWLHANRWPWPMVRFRRHDVFKLWPAQANEHFGLNSPSRSGLSPLEDMGSDRAPSRFSVGSLRKWYVSEWIPSHESDTAIPSRDEDVRAAKARFGPCVSRDTVWQLRRELAPKSWTKRGRRPKTVAKETVDN